MNRPVLRALTVLLALALTATSATAENWPHWRGPNFDGTSAETDLPTQWHAGEDGTENIRWHVELPGAAGSSPIVWDDTVYLTSAEADGDGLSVLAIGTDGTMRWQTQVDSGSVTVFEQFAHETNAAASSPVTDGEHVWALFGTGKLYRLSVDGKIMWTVDLVERYGAPSLYFGYSASPLLLDGRLYIQLLHAEAQLVVALDAATGQEIWKVERPSDSKQESRQSYASVLPYRSGDATQILIHGSDYLTGHDAGTGEELWRFGTLNPEDSYNPMYRFVTSPVVHDDLVVVPTAKRGPVFGLRPGDARGNLATDAPSIAWTLERGTPDVPSPVVLGGIVYLSGENGRLTALDLETGEEIYAERAHQSQHRGSPVVGRRQGLPRGHRRHRHGGEGGTHVRGSGAEHHRGGTTGRVAGGVWRRDLPADLRVALRRRAEKKVLSRTLSSVRLLCNNGWTCPSIAELDPAHRTAQ